MEVISLLITLGPVVTSYQSSSISYHLLECFSPTLLFPCSHHPPLSSCFFLFYMEELKVAQLHLKKFII